MSTPNFSRVNARNYCAVLDAKSVLNESGEEATYSKDEWDYENDLTFLAEVGSERGFEPTGTCAEYSREFKACPCLDKDVSGCWGNDERLGWFDFTLKIYAVPGYYSGMTYDYEVFVKNYDSDEAKLSQFEDVEEMADCLVDCYKDSADWRGQNHGLTKCHAPHLKKWLIEKINHSIEGCEEVCKAACDIVWYKAAQFSNGEAFYEHIAV